MRVRRAAQGASLLEAGRSVVRRSGWGGLYKGNLVNVLHSAPQKALSFFAFDAFKVRRVKARDLSPDLLPSAKSCAVACMLR